MAAAAQLTVTPQLPSMAARRASRGCLNARLQASPQKEDEDILTAHRACMHGHVLQKRLMQLEGCNARMCSPQEHTLAAKCASPPSAVCCCLLLLAAACCCLLLLAAAACCMHHQRDELPVHNRKRP